jgi:hypothetical protein
VVSSPPADRTDVGYCSRMTMPASATSRLENDSRRRITIRHVVPLVGPSAPLRLRRVQDVTLDSIERALDYSRNTVIVEVVGAHFIDEPLPTRPWLVGAPVLTTSSSDLSTFKVARRLPLLREVLDGFGASRVADAFIITNTDIGLQPVFYDLVADILRLGYDAFSINRRTVAPVFAPSASVLAQAAVGRQHPGTDCLVFAPRLLDGVDVGDVLMGVRYVTRTLREEVTARARRHRVFSELHATFHLGDDKLWKDNGLRDYEDFNRNELTKARTRRADSKEVATSRVDGERHARLIFCAAPARSGTQFLAGLLGSAPGVDAGHERPPSLSGQCFADTQELGLETTYEHRMAKVDAIRAELAIHQGPVTYVDTSHLFLTMFYDVVLDAFDHRQISVVRLCRDPVDVARSMFELGWFSSKNDAWKSWISPADGPQSPIGFEEGDLNDPLDRIIGHLAHVLHARENLRGATPTVNWVDADLPSIATRRGGHALLETLGLKRGRQRIWARRRPVNGRKNRKRKIDRPITRSEVDTRIESFLERFASLPGTRDLRREYERWGH